MTTDFTSSRARNASTATCSSTSSSFTARGCKAAVPLLRGTTRGLATRVGDRSAKLSGLDYRHKLRSKITLPALAADVPEVRQNLFPTTNRPSNATWVVSYVLSGCGFPLAPPPRSQYCRFYGPMHRLGGSPSSRRI